MEYKVIDVLAVGTNTSVTIDGSGKGLKNGMTITAPNGEEFKLLSIGMTSGNTAASFGKATSMLIEGNFAAKAFTA